MRSDRRPVFETCWTCPGHDNPDTLGPVIAASVPLAQLTDPALHSLVQVVLSRAWMHEHGPRPSSMTLHVMPPAGEDAGKREVALSGRPWWQE